MRWSLVIPAHNEEARLSPMLRAYIDYFVPRYGEEIEFIVVVNGSIDQTEAVARSYAAACAGVRVLVEPQAIGKGGAIMLGAAAAQGDWIGFVDADGATPPAAFEDLMEYIGDAGAIFASRWMPGSVVEPRQPLKRRIASRIFNFLVRKLFKVRITDTQCGAKLIQGAALRRILPDLGLTRWAFDVDLLFKLRRAGYRIIEHPTVWRDVAGSQLRVGRASLEMFVAICRLRLLYSPFRFVVTLYDRTIGRVRRT
jgi:glycosyltransferase involved in cell wall biosynthesis